MVNQATTPNTCIQHIDPSLPHHLVCCFFLQVLTLNIPGTQQRQNPPTFSQAKQENRSIAESMNTISVIVSILILAFLPHQLLGDDSPMLARLSGRELVVQVCAHAEFKQLCLSSLKSAPGSEDADLFNLTSIALKLAAVNATDTKNHIQSLLKASKSEYERECLTDCLENYEDAINRIYESVEILKTRGYTDINGWVTAAVGDADSCEEGFHERPGQNSLLAARNQMFNQLCGTVLTITKLLSSGA